MKLSASFPCPICHQMTGEPVDTDPIEIEHPTLSSRIHKMDYVGRVSCENGHVFKITVANEDLAWCGSCGRHFLPKDLERVAKVLRCRTCVCLIATGRPIYKLSQCCWPSRSSPSPGTAHEQFHFSCIICHNPIYRDEDHFSGHPLRNTLPDTYKVGFSLGGHGKGVHTHFSCAPAVADDWKNDPF